MDKTIVRNKKEYDEFVESFKSWAVFNRILNSDNNFIFPKEYPCFVWVKVGRNQNMIFFEYLEDVKKAFDCASNDYYSLLGESWK